MIDLKNKVDCCGCGACAQSCPKKCIEMKPNAEGFLYPEIDKARCVDCHLCEKVCPMISRKENSVLSVYAAQNKNDEVRSQSSSGGVFRLICENILNQGGVVFGCAFDENIVAKHIAVEKIEDIQKLQSSKYVQSDIGDVYICAEEFLKQGRLVLFSGTPCQIAGLKNYLGKEYENLFTVDLLCHGVPSPGVFEDYIRGLESKYCKKITVFNFRDKRKSWKRLFVRAEFKNGKEYFKFCGYDSYLSMFLNNISQRPSCFKCPFATTNRQGDITLGDFWGIGRHIPEMDGNKGTSMVITNTQKGAEMWKQIRDNTRCVETNIDVAISGNRVLLEPPKKSPNRDRFYEMYINEGYEKAAEKYAQVPSIFGQMYYNMMRIALDIYRFIFKKTY